MIQHFFFHLLVPCCTHPHSQVKPVTEEGVIKELKCANEWSKNLRNANLTNKAKRQALGVVEAGMIGWAMDVSLEREKLEPRQLDGLITAFDAIMKEQTKIYESMDEKYSDVADE